MANISKAQGALKAAQNALQKQEAEYAEALAKAQKMKASEMSKSILDAIDLVTEHKLERLEFDKTLVCTIEDDTNKKKGEYIVTDGSTSFTAYSDVTIYMKGLRVYVTVPNGNFDNKKLITGRYIDSENAEYYTYKPPFEDYLDMSGNLIKNNIEKGLVANHPTNKEVVVWQTDNFTQGKGYTLLGIKADFRSWLSSYKAKSGEYGLRLDIESRETSTSQGEDKLKHYSCELTNNDMYGNPYNFETFYSQEKTFDIAKISEIVSMKLVFFQKPGTFKDKNGKEIQYKTISNKTSLEKIESDRLKAIRDLKVSDFETEAAYYEALEKINGEYEKKRKKLEMDLPANLFVKNPYISLGYAEQDFEEDTVLLMSLDSKTYDATSTKTQNTKTINARWIHFIKNEDGTDSDVVSIDYEDEIPLNAEIHWYRYYLSEGLDDELAGVFWDEIESNKNKLSYTFYPDINTEFERIKVIVENPSRKYVKLQKQLELNRINMDDSIDEGEKLIQKQAVEEDYSYESKVNYYESEVIVFENEKPVANPATVDLIQGLQISVDPADKGGLDGKYCIYGVDYKLLNNAEKERLRPLEATYSSLVTGEPTLDKAAKITWKIPLQHTMIHPPQVGKEFHYKITNEKGEEVPEPSIIEFLYSNGTKAPATADQIEKKEYPEEATHILISRDGTENYSQSDDTEAMQIEVKQYFRIKELYTPGDSNNTIECIVLKNNIEYPASAQLTFGPQGTNGTNYTLSLEFDNNESCLLATSADGLGVTAHLFDYENKPIEDVTCSFSWYSGDGKKMESLGKGSMKTIVKVAESYRNNRDLDYYILQGVINYGKETKVDEETGEKTEIPGVDLTAYLPIPIKYDNSFTLAEAPTTIIYDNNGTNPVYYKGGLKIYKEDQSKPFKDDSCFWQITTTDTTGQEKGFYPFVRDDANGNSEVVPTNSYYSKENSSGEMVPLKEVALQYIKTTVIDTENSTEEVLWTQPLLIQQNRWPSAMLNKWDGTLQIDNKEGTILSQMVGAGYKDSQNRYNGVLMGNVNIALASDAAVSASTPENPVQAATRKNGTTGVYGFHEGAPSFGFMDNGTAFLGKKGAGQILLDGKKSTIQSSSYRNGTGDAKTEGLKPGQQGMCIDLDDGWIDMQGPGENNKAVVHLDTRGTVGSTHHPYFNIKSQAGRNMMMISPNEYYLQTDGYQVETTSNGETTPGQGIKLDLKNSKLTGYNFHLKTIESSGTYQGSYVELNSGGKPYFRVHYKKAKTNGKNESDSVKKARDHDLIYIGTDNFYLQSRRFDSTDQTGTKINLDSGKITSYNFNLEAGTGANKIILNSSSSGNNYPLKIGPNFSVKWNGYMTASSGKIGGWTIGTSSLTSTTGKTTLNSNGNITCDYLKADGTVNVGGTVNVSGTVNIGGTVHIGGGATDSITLAGQVLSIKNIDVVTGVNHWADEAGDSVTFWALRSNSIEDAKFVKVTIREPYTSCNMRTIPMLAGGTNRGEVSSTKNKANIVSVG